jgi:hypothetical protein
VLQGFVRFQHRVIAERARAALDGKVITINGKVLEDPEAEGPRCRITWGDANTQHNCVHFRFDIPFPVPEHFSEDAENNGPLSFNEDDIAEHFSSCGNVIRVTLPRFMDGTLKGYAFVHFSDDVEGETAAARAINKLHESMLMDKVKILCNFGKKQQPPSKIIPKKRRLFIPTGYQPSGVPMMHPLNAASPHSIQMSPTGYTDHSFFPMNPVDFYGYPVYMPHQAAWIPPYHRPPVGELPHYPVVEQQYSLERDAEPAVGGPSSILPPAAAALTPDNVYSAPPAHYFHHFPHHQPYPVPFSTEGFDRLGNNKQQSQQQPAPSTSTLCSPPEPSEQG